MIHPAGDRGPNKLCENVAQEEVSLFSSAVRWFLVSGWYPI